MKINEIELYLVRMPLIYPWRTAYGEDHDIYSVLVKIVSEKVYGWGETTPLKAPSYSPEWAGGAFSVIRDFLAPRIVGQHIDNAGQLLDLLRHFKGNQFAKAGLETAIWILKAKSENKPLHQLIGGTKEEVDVGADFGVQDSLDILVRKVHQAIDEGYPRVKLKFRLGWDINMLAIIRDAFPNYTFHIDCNAAFNLKNIDLFKKVDRFDLAMIEQPLHYNDLLDHAVLQKALSTPICLDESITGLKRMEQAIQLKSCGYVNIKAGRVGGLSNAIKIHDMCKEAGIPCWVGGMLESAVGNGISIELATLSNFRYPADIFPSKVHYNRDLARPEITLCSPGKIEVSRVPGIPYEPDIKMLKNNTLQHAVIRP